MNRKKCTRLATIVIAFMLCVLSPFAVTYPAHAETTASVSLGQLEGAAGQTIEWPINLSSSGDIARVEFDLEYDTQLLNCISSEKGSLTQDFTVTHNQLTSRLHLAIFSPAGKLIPQGSGTVAVVKFLVLPTTQGGQSSSLHLAGVVVPDLRTGKTAVSVIQADGSIKVLTSSQTSATSSSATISTTTQQNQSTGTTTAAEQYTTARTGPVGPVGPTSTTTTASGTNPTINSAPPGPTSNQPAAGNATGANTSQPSSTQVKDIQNHWAKTYIEKLINRKVISGYADGSFKPDNNISRAEFAKLITVALNLPINPNVNLSFSDSAKIDAWARPYIGAAVNAGIISGYSDKSFQPGRNISRSEIAVMIARAIKSSDGKALTFVDAQKIPSWAAPSVKAAVQKGIINGKPGNRFMPADNATRAEAATMIAKTLEVGR